MYVIRTFVGVCVWIGCIGFGVVVIIFCQGLFHIMLLSHFVRWSVRKHFERNVSGQMYYCDTH